MDLDDEELEATKKKDKNITIGNIIDEAINDVMNNPMEILKLTKKQSKKKIKK